MTRESTTLVAEFVGTFLLTGAVLFGLNPAVALGVLVLLMSGFSAAHFNPAVSAGMAAARRITGATMVKFWIVQVLGALLARVAYGYFMADKVSLAMSFKTVDAKMFLAEVVGGAIFVGGIMLAVKQGLGSLKLGAAVGGAPAGMIAAMRHGALATFLRAGRPRANPPDPLDGPLGDLRAACRVPEVRGKF
jgi:glycerol uptake facilitator-like aquaporin